MYHSTQSIVRTACVIFNFRCVCVCSCAAEETIQYFPNELLAHEYGEFLYDNEEKPDDNDLNNNNNNNTNYATDKHYLAVPSAVKAWFKNPNTEPDYPNL